MEDLTDVMSEESLRKRQELSSVDTKFINPDGYELTSELVKIATNRRNYWSDVMRERSRAYCSTRTNRLGQLFENSYLMVKYWNRILMSIDDYVWMTGGLDLENK